MQLTESEDAPAVSADAPLGFRLALMDELFKTKEIYSISAQARALGLAKSHWLKLRSSEVQPLVNLVYRIAAFLDSQATAIYGPPL